MFALEETAMASASGCESRDRDPKWTINVLLIVATADAVGRRISSLEGIRNTYEDLL